MRLEVIHANLLKGLCLALLMIGCSPNHSTKLAANGTGESKEAIGARAEGTDERVDVPVNVAGSYLACALRKQADSSDLNAQYGCRLNAAGTKDKLDIEAMRQQISWASSSPNVTINLLPKEDVWHAYYNVKGDSIQAINAIGASLDVQVRWKSTTKAPIPFKQATITQVLVPAQDYGDTTAPVVMEGGIDPYDPPAL